MRGRSSGGGHAADQPALQGGVHARAAIPSRHLDQKATTLYQIFPGRLLVALKREVHIAEHDGLDADVERWLRVNDDIE
jgi:hypothetical protein